jgi:hypothetical protein
MHYFYYVCTFATRILYHKVLILFVEINMLTKLMQGVDNFQRGSNISIRY